MESSLLAVSHVAFEVEDTENKFGRCPFAVLGRQVEIAREDSGTRLPGLLQPGVDFGQGASGGGLLSCSTQARQSMRAGG